MNPLRFLIPASVLLIATPALAENHGHSKHLTTGLLATEHSAVQMDVSFKDGGSTPTTVASFNASAGELPESIAVDHFGNIYVSMTSLRQIWKLDPAGAFLEIVASFSLEPAPFGVGPFGLRFGPQGDLYVAVGSTLPDKNGVWKITSSSEKERIPGTGGIVGPNDVAVAPDGTLYITDSVLGAVWRYMPGGQAEVWIQDETLEGTGAFGVGFPIGANGIVVAQGEGMPLARRSGKASIGGVIVANAEKGQLVYVPILPDGSAGEPMIVIADPALFSLDGITVDARGTIYGAVSFASTIVRISRDGSDISVVASGAPLDFPTGLAFGSGRDRHTLFVVNSAVGHFLSDPPTPELANPAVIAIPVFAINYGITGSWSNPDHPGARQGFSLEVIDMQTGSPDLLNAYWFTYALGETGGVDTERWFNALGEVSGNQAVMDAIRCQGGIFADPTAADCPAVGTVTLTFTSCTAGLVDYALNLSGGPEMETVGSFPISRLTPDVLCEDLADDQAR